MLSARWIIAAPTPNETENVIKKDWYSTTAPRPQTTRKSILISLETTSLSGSSSNFSYSSIVNPSIMSATTSTEMLITYPIATPTACSGSLRGPSKETRRGRCIVGLELAV